ncbi:MAG: hypothetical protein KDK62_06610 [Chlamydiia bacterium]|nr:hypothetical protein [Chlamydiia bacterium]
MSTFTLTLILALAVILLATLGLALSWLITGKFNYRLGSCGKDPNKGRDENCGNKSACSLCKKDDDKD